MARSFVICQTPARRLRSRFRVPKGDDRQAPDYDHRAGERARGLHQGQGDPDHRTEGLPDHGDSSGKIKELETALKACNEERSNLKEKSEEAAAAHAEAIADYKRQLALAAEQAEKDAATIKELQAKLAEASVEAVKASEASAKLSAASATSALEATKLILARAESLEASREAVPDDAKKAASLDGLN